MNAIETINLTKVFKVKGKVIKALEDVNIKVDKGVVASLVGPNGAGKTTLIKILSTIIVPTSGDAYVNGYSVLKDEKKVREQIGLVTVSERIFYYRLTALENLIFFGSLQGMTLSEIKERAMELLDLVGLKEWANVPYMKFSTGMQRKLALVRALLTDPPILLLDEPTLGLDPLSQRMFREIIRKISRNKTIILTSHYMKDIEELANFIYIIKRGRIIASGTPAELKRMVGKIYEIRTTEVPTTYAKYVISDTGSYAILRIPESEEGAENIISSSEIIKEDEPSLEDVYVYLVGEEMDSIRYERFRGRGGWSRYT